LTLFRFGDFEFDDASLELRSGGEPLDIEPKPLALLVELLRAPGHVLTRDELMARLWPDTHVGRGSLTRAVHALRSTLGESAADGALVRTLRGRGYQIAVAVRAVSDSTRDADAFVGRAAELDEGSAAIAAARGGRPRVVLLAGEPGIGKTRLALELSDRARAAGLGVHWGRCREAEGTPGLWPWIQVLRALAERRELAELAPAARAELAQLDPEFAEDRRAAVPDPPADAVSRLRRWDAVATALRAAARRAPRLLVLDDVHAADDASLELLSFLVRELTVEPLLVIVAFRDTEPRRDMLERVRGQLAAAGARTLSLRGLTLEESARCLAQQLEREPPLEVVAEIQRRSSGNPLFVRELARLLHEARTTRGEPLPLGIRDVVQQRLATLPKACVVALRAAAVFGREFSTDLLAAVLELPEPELLARLEAAIELGFVEPAPRWTGGLRFAHALFQEVIYADLTSRERSLLHERAARALETLRTAELDAHAATLAHHFSEAAPRCGPERALHWARRAALRARAEGALDRVALHNEQIVGAHALTAPPVDAAQRCDALLELAEARALAGPRQRAVEAAREAAQLGRSSGDPARLARAALAMSTAIPSVFPDAALEALLEEALERLPASARTLRAQVLGRLAAVLQGSGRFERAAAVLRASLVEARSLDDEQAALEVLSQHLRTLQEGLPAEDPRPRVALADDVIGRAQRLGRIEAELQARMLRVGLLLEIGDRRAVDEEVERYAAAGERSRIRMHRHRAAVSRAMQALLSGRGEEARRWLARAEILADPLDPSEVRFTPVTLRLLLAKTPGDWSEGERLAREIAADFPRWRAWRFALAFARKELAVRDEVRALLDELAAGGFAPTAPAVNQPVELAVAAEVSSRIGEPRYAREIYERLSPWSEVNVVQGLGVACHGPAAYFLALLADLLGDRRLAALHLEAAGRMALRLASPPWQSRVEEARRQLRL